jgi:hypothetical protein
VATLGLFAVHDVKAAQYLPPFASMNEGTAQRQFASAVMSEGHDFNVHAADYSLWSIGEFDSETAEIKTSTKTMLVNAFDLKTQLEMDFGGTDGKE